MDFRAVAERHLLKHVSRIEERSCPDQYVGSISVIEEKKAFPFRHLASARPLNPCVLLILESPHIREFKEEPAPAKGTTGTNIARLLQKLPGLELTGDFGLILINAIQYQCSLGLSTDSVRDNVFLDVWSHGGKQNFISRLKAIHRLGDRIVNCCTKGSSRKVEGQLRVLVQHAIEDAKLNVPVLQRTHPSSWHFPANLARD